MFELRPKNTASWEMKQLARPLRGLASRFSGKFYVLPARRSPERNRGGGGNEVKARSGLFLKEIKNFAITKIESNVVVKISVLKVARIAKALDVTIENLIK